MGRAPCCDKANVKKGPWSPEEDAKLKTYIEKNGTGGNWIALPQKIGLKRCGKSCRLRWLNYLRPNLKHGGFTEEEENIICSLFISIGSRWSIIAAQLPGRTDNDIKNYWNTRLKKKLMAKQRKEQAAVDQSINQLPYYWVDQQPGAGSITMMNSNQYSHFKTDQDQITKLLMKYEGQFYDHDPQLVNNYQFATVQNDHQLSYMDSLNNVLESSSVENASYDDRHDDVNNGVLDPEAYLSNLVWSDGTETTYSSGATCTSSWGDMNSQLVNSTPVSNNFNAYQRVPSS